MKDAPSLMKNFSWRYSPGLPNPAAIAFSSRTGTTQTGTTQTGTTQTGTIRIEKIMREGEGK
jgi:hypothetical protein